MDRLRKVTNYGKNDWARCCEFVVGCYMNSHHRAIGCTPKEAWNSSSIDGIRNHKDKYMKTYGKKNKGINELKIGNKILYHHPVEKKNKLSADYNYSGIVVGTHFGSVYIKLTDGRTIRSALKNVKRLF